MKSPLPVVARTSALLSLLFFTGFARATTFTWRGASAVSDQWTTTGTNQNWINGTTSSNVNWPGSGDDNDAIFTAGGFTLKLPVDTVRLDDLTNQEGTNIVQGNGGTQRSITLTGGTYDGTGTTGSVFDITGTFRFAADVGGAKAPRLTGTSDLVKTGAGTLHLNSNVHNFSGSIYVLAGTLQINGDGGLGNTANNIYLDGGTLFQNTGGNITLTSGRTLYLGPTSGTGSGTLRGGNMGFTVAGVIADNAAGTGSLLWQSNGKTLTLSNANTFSGSTSITGAGNILINHADSLQNSTVMTGTGNFDFSSSITAANMGGLSGNGDLVLENAAAAAVTLAVGNNDEDTTYSGVLSGSGALTKTGTGTLTLEGHNTFAGDTLIDRGTILAAAADVLPSGSLLKIGGTGGGGDSLFLLNGFDQTIGGLRSVGNNTRAIRNGSSSIATLTIDNTGDETYASQLGNGSVADDNNFNLVKTGAGDQTLSNTLFYTGTTTISGGLLRITGNILNSSAVTVENGGTLEVAGSVSSAPVIVDAGGTLQGGGLLGANTTISGIHRPGSSPGIQTFANGLSYTSSATLNWELGSNTASPADRGVAPYGYDGVDVTGGSFAQDGLATVDLAFGSGVNFADVFWGTDQSWLVIDLQGAATAADSNVFTLGAITLAGLPYDPSGDGTFSLFRAAGSTSENGVWLQWTAVPEPAVTLLGTLGSLILLRRRR